MNLIPSTNNNLDKQTETNTLTDSEILDKIKEDNIKLVTDYIKEINSNPHLYTDNHKHGQEEYLISFIKLTPNEQEAVDREVFSMLSQLNKQNDNAKKEIFNALTSLPIKREIFYNLLESINQ